ncbi:hypothetical protein TrLO_g14333 [Triparma laevis f. longispina]|uniref:Uncharacterized protein n=1 Tax=Triparma laevis f. longispina TaxID=1714387 RepID=A0A9W7DTI5_9STRA|nr:hypothetical protein TrLO_g14333 [Triparma laevis f. longispina]
MSSLNHCADSNMPAKLTTFLTSQSLMLSPFIFCESMNILSMTCAPLTSHDDKSGENLSRRVRMSETNDNAVVVDKQSR